jgi:hypothetical protein
LKAAGRGRQQLGARGIQNERERVKRELAAACARGLRAIGFAVLDGAWPSVDFGGCSSVVCIVDALCVCFYCGIWSA